MNQPLIQATSRLAHPRRGLAPAALLVAILLAMGMFALLDRAGVVYAAHQNPSPDAMLYVVPSGGATSGTCKRASVGLPTPTGYSYPACTLNYALSIATDGSTLALAKGDYQQSTIISKSVTLIGGYETNFATGLNAPLSTPIINVTNLMPLTAEPVVIVRSQLTNTVTTTVVLEGLRLFHPSAQERGIVLEKSTTVVGNFPIALELRDTKIQLNTKSGAEGGGLYVGNDVIAVINLSNNVEFSFNEATNGGAIYLSAGSTLTGNNAIFSGNKATNGNGGAIYAPSGSSVNLTAVTMNLNQAGGNGGAIYATNITLNYTSGSISGNTATNGGGGLYLDGGSASISGAQFLTNTANAGGGLYIQNTTSGALTGNTIQYNRANTNGGGVYLDNADLSVDGLELKYNTAQVNGGGLYASQSQAAATGPVSLTGNTATSGSGGGVYLAAGAHLAATAATFEQNTAQLSGGALYADQAAYTVSMTTTATSNTATTLDGGAFYFSNSQAGLGVAMLQLNKANLNGGAIFAASSVITGTTLNAETNTATTGNGGAFSLQGTTVAWSGNSTLKFNKANVHGGAYYISGGSVQVGGTATILSNTVTTGSGGGVYLTANAGFAVSGTVELKENIAQIDGGGIFVDTGTLTLPGSGTISQNVATTGNGGGINFANSTTATFGAFTFQSNRAQVNGGALRAQASTLVFTGATNAISNTASSGSGGAFHLTVGLSTTFQQALTAKGNTASISGGTIYATDTALSFGNNSEISDNVAQTGSGGGVYLDNGALTTQKISFLRNKAKIDGGGLYALNGPLTLANASVVQLNQAQTGNGGGIYAGGGAATLTGVLIEQNTAQINGGGIYLTGSNPLITALTIESASTVRQNKSNTAQGGGIFSTGGTVTIDASMVESNQAQTGGGGLYQHGGTLVVTNTAIVQANSTITGGGGGLAILTGTVTIANSGIHANSTQADGAGLYAPGGQVTVLGSEFTGNTVTYGTATLEITTNALTFARGGAIYVDGTNVIVENSTFEDNYATMGGGAIYARTLYASIANSEFTGNNGGRGIGGALYLSADLAKVKQNTLEGNHTASHGGGLAIEDTDASEIISNTLTSNYVRLDTVITSTVMQYDVKIVETGEVILRKGDRVTGENSTEGSGGGVYFLRSAGTFSGNQLLRNENESGDGGGVFLSSSNLTMTNNVIAQNSVAISNAYASGIYVNNTTLFMLHNTVAENVNSSPSSGAKNVGIYITRSGENSSAVMLTNNIIAFQRTGVMLMTGNTAGILNNVFFNTDEDWGGTIEYLPASGNKVGDPLFVDPVNDNYNIQRKSAAFDMGLATPVTTDITGTPRPRAFGVDAGAYEHRYQQGVYMRVTASPIFVGSGDQISYQVQVVNHSPVPLTGVNLSFALPSQQAAGGISGPGCSGTSCSLGTMNPDQMHTVTLVTTANGTPPAQGFIEMLTTVNVSVGGSGPSDSSETVRTLLQRCRIRYANNDYATITAAIAAVNTSDDLPDIIRVSGYCGGGFEINKKLTIQGGWDFSMTTYDPTLYPTTIDGGNMGRVIKIVGDIAPTVENLILRNGSASGLGGGPSGKDAGGIVYIQDARATLQNVRMVGGRAAYGANLYVGNLTAPIIRDSTIENGQAERGGGVYANGGSPEITNVTIQNNTAQAGGGVYLFKGEAKLLNCTIRDNHATGSGSYLQVAGFNIRFSVGGGGGVNFDESKGSISGCTFERNHAKAGGAIFADNSPASVSSSILHDNEATGSPSVVPIIVLANEPGGGGAIYAQRSDVVVEHNRITNNRSTGGPGGAIHIFNGSSDAKINGNFLGFNSASEGSAVYVFLRPDTFKIFVLPITIPDFLLPILLGQPQPNPPKLTMTNNTIAHNGGSSAVYFYGESYGELVGNIIAFNSGTGVVAKSEILPYIALIPVPIIFVIPIPFAVPYMSTVTVDYTLWYQNGGTVSSSLGSSVSNTNSSTGDPAFKNDGYHIKRISAAYNTGKNVGIAIDIDGQTRPQADITDMGADEYPAIGVRYVAPGGADTAAGERCRNFLNPCGTLQDAIDAASEGDLIKMAGGTYSTMATRDGQTQLGYINKTLTIQGGYFRYTTDNSVTEGQYTANDWEVPFPDINPTILDAGNKGRAFYIRDEKRVDSEGNPIKVEPVISGVIIKNGNSNGQRGPQGNQFDAGGAIYLDKTTATIVDVDISNSIADYGGAVYMISSTITLDDVIVHNNTANERGGGFYLETSNDVTISNIVIDNNKAPRGAGLYLDRSAATITNNQIRSNGDSAATLEGGGFYLDNSPATMISNTVNANSAANGGGFFTFQSDAILTGNAFTNNNALNTGSGNGRGGGCFIGPGSANLQNNLFEGNKAILGAGCFLNDSSAFLSKNQVLENIATNSGGGFYLRNSSDASLQENTITNNRANSTAVDNGGGGLFLESSNSLLRLNTVTNNTANAGGGIYLFSFSNANVQENQFSNNTATLDGGGAYIKLSDAQFAKNTITFNQSAQGSGGGVFLRLSNAQFSENIIEDNSATQNGGGVFFSQSGTTLRRDSVRNNRAKDGAGIYVFTSDTAVFDRVTIELNRATQFGGGIYIRLSSVPLEDHVIVDNYALVAGGGVYIDESAVDFNRNIVRNNRADQQGGGIAITRRSFAKLGSNAVVDNRAGSTGSGIYIAGSQPKLVHTTVARNLDGDGTGVAAVSGDGSPSNVTMVNSILASQSLAVSASTGSTITLEATLWDNNGQNWSIGAGKILTGSADLNFFGEARFQADGIHIQKSSKAIGVGIESEVGRDIDGEGRPQGNGPELGADELLADCSAVVDKQLNVVYTNVQTAINAANPGDEVRISGTCVGAQLVGGTTQLAFVNKEITVRGGYSPTNWLVSYPITQPTFLDAQGMGRVLFVAAGVNATIEHLNLAGGDARGQGGGPGGLDAGGNLYVRNANPRLNHLTISNGSAYYGGGFYLENSTTTLADSTMDGNAATKGGAGFLRNAQVTLRGNTIEGNTSADGAGLFVSFSQSVLVDNVLSLNTATAAGGGIFLESSSATVTDNSIVTNTAQSAGGIYVDGGTPSVLRNDINANTGQNGGGIYLAATAAIINGNQFIGNNGGIGAGVYVNSGNPSFDNNVVAKNVGQIQAAGIYVLSSSPKLRHNTLSANIGGDGSGLFITDQGVQPANIDMVNNIVVNHTTAISLTAGNKVTVRHNLWHNNVKDWGGSGLVDDKGGHVRGDPLFVNPDGGDFHLQPASPARDQGANDAGVNVDYDNQGRPADNGFDIGADEFVFTGIQVFIQTVPDPVVAGADFKLVVRVVNIGNIDQNAKITVTLPTEMTPSGIVSFDALIPRSETWIQTINATVNAAFSGNLKVRADVTSSEGTSESLEASIVVAKPDFAITLVAEAFPSPVPAGAELTYQIRVNNVGNRPLNATVEAEFPAAVSAAAPLVFAPGALGPGGAWTKSLITNVAADAEGNLSATFRATTQEGPSATYTLIVPIAEPSLVTTVSATPDPVLAGQTVTYTLRVENTGNVDFTNTITFVAPLNGNGRPLIAPGADQVFTNVAIPAGTVWEQIIVAVVQPTYVGPLNSQVRIDTHTGLVIVHDDTRQVILPQRGPTIVAVRTGAWNDPTTWQPERVPNAEDIALVQEGVVVTVDGRNTNPIEMTGLINNGTILLNCSVGTEVELRITSFIENNGLIRGRDGQTIGEPGCAIAVSTNELINPGTIRGGDGMDGAVVPPNNDIINGGDGGPVSIFAQNLLNDGEIRGGDGGNLLAPATSGKGGNGGDVLVVAGPPVPALLINSGLIAAGNGGAGPNPPDGRGGNGGSATVFSASQFINDGGEVRAGLGGEPGGSDGAVSISAAFIWDNGVMTVNGTDYDFGTQAKAVVRGVAGATVLVPVTFLNAGMRSDVYILIWANSRGWQQDFLPDTTQRINSLRYGIVFAPFTIPPGTPGGVESELTLSARSQGLPSLLQEETIRVLVVSGEQLWLPNIFRNGNTSPGGQTPSDDEQVNFLPFIDR